MFKRNQHAHRCCFVSCRSSCKCAKTAKSSTRKPLSRMPTKRLD